jgi:hypothetical protein
MSIPVAFFMQADHADRKAHIDAIRASLSTLGFPDEAKLAAVLDALDDAQLFGGRVAVPALLDEEEFELLKRHAANLFGEHCAVQLNTQCELAYA